MGVNTIETVKYSELNGNDTKALRELELKTRRNLAELKLDPFGTTKGSDIKKLKRNLARIMTAKTSIERGDTK